MLTWMAWTWPTAAFLAFIAACLITMTVLELRRPGGAPRRGVLGLDTTRGDRLFIWLLGSAFIFLAWLGLVGTPLWAPLAIALVYGFSVFRWVKRIVVVKRIGLVAHDARKADLVDWAKARRDLLAPHSLIATGTTGGALRDATGLEIECMKSGPLGGDSQIGARIAEGKLDILVFFTDPLSALPHDVDVKALTRLATLYNTVLACNRATADYVIESPYLLREYRHGELPGTYE